MKDMGKADRIAGSVNEFCSAVGIGRTLFYREVRQGRIRILKAGRKTLVPVAEREAYLRILGGAAK